MSTQQTNNVENRRQRKGDALIVIGKYSCISVMTEPDDIYHVNINRRSFVKTRLSLPFTKRIKAIIHVVFNLYNMPFIVFA
jgi:hypothetical protein